MLNRKLFNFAVFATAMAYLESAVVVYLREIYYPDGFQFPLMIIGDRIAVIEIGREAATVVMLWFITRMASEKFKEQLALFLFSFGIWDIFYYIWLKLFIAWPAAWLEWDVLFLIPIPWVGPWLAPFLVSIGFILSAIMILKFEDRFEEKIFNLKEWILILLSFAFILQSFFWESEKVLSAKIPEYYPWWLFFLGYAVGSAVFIRRLLFKKIK